jgi:hypothetical protein
MLTPAWTQLRPHALQAQLWRTRARFVAVAAGRGSGKTEIARRRMIRMLPVKENPWDTKQFFYALPTYKQARRVAWRPLMRLIPREWIKGNPNESEMRIDTVYGSSLYVVGLDKPQRVEGDQWDGCVIDESCDQKPGHFTRSILPALSHKNGWCWRIGVPKRVGVGAHEFKEFCENATGFGTEYEAYTWPSEDILTSEQLAWARANLDAKDYNEQYLASWESISGAIFYAFDEVLNVRNDVAYDPKLPLIIGSDFNVDPMAWVVCQLHGADPHGGAMQDRSNQELHVLDELWVRNTNTADCLTRLHERFASHTAGFEFFGDATSRARNTRASESDYIQILNDTRFNTHVMAGVHYPRTNPSRSNRFAACNALFCNADKKRRCIVHPRCKNLIKDLATRGYKEGSNEPNDYGDIGHITDALGYVIHAVFPVAFKVESAPIFSTVGV